MSSSRTLSRIATACAVLVGAAACSDWPSPTDLDLEDGPFVLAAKGGNKGGNGKGNGGDGGGGDTGGDDIGGTLDEFETLDLKRWEVTDKQFYDTYFDPANVTVSGGFLHLKTPAGTWDGGEIVSKKKFGSGTYSARIKASTAPGSLTAFFLYEFTSNAFDEIDIEIVPDLDINGRGPGGPHLILGTYVRDVRTNSVHIPVSDLDPDFDIGKFHTYTIEAQRRYVRFFVDGALVQEFTEGIPSARMRLVASTWFPRWLVRPVPDRDYEAVFDWIRF